MRNHLNDHEDQNKRLRNIENLLSLQKNVLNIMEVCILTGLSKSTVYKFTSAGGRIPFYKQAKHLYFKRTEIEEWLLSNRGFNLEEINEEASTYLTLKRKEVHKPKDRTQLKPKRMNTDRLGNRVSKGITEENQNDELLDSTESVDNSKSADNDICLVSTSSPGFIKDGGDHVR